MTPHLYLSGPMSGYPLDNYPAFHAEARRLRELGYHVENPAENPPPSDRSWHGYMRLALAQLLTCEGIALLPGWERSRGATLEHHVAKALGMLVFDAHLIGERAAA